MKTIPVPLAKATGGEAVVISNAIQGVSDNFHVAFEYICKGKEFAPCGQAVDKNLLIKIFSDGAGNRIITFCNNLPQQHQHTVQRLRYETAVGLTICDESLPLDNVAEYENIGNRMLELIEKHDKKFPKLSEQVDILQAGNETARYWYEKSNMQENPNAWFSAAHRQEGIIYRYYGKTLQLKNKKEKMTLANNGFWCLSSKNDVLTFDLGIIKSTTKINPATVHKLLAYSIRKNLLSSAIHSVFR